MTNSAPEGPNRWYTRLLRALLPPGDSEAVLAELAELYQRRVVTRGRSAADAWYRREVVRFVAALVRERFGRNVRGGSLEGGGGTVGTTTSGGGGGLGAVRQELASAWRQVIRRPGGAIAAVLVLALGIGSGTAVFSVVDGVVIRPLPFPDPHRLVNVVEARAEDGARMGLSAPSSALWSGADLPSVEGLAAHTPTDMDLVGSGDPVEIGVAAVSHGFFGVLGVRPTLGRTFTADDDRADAPGAVILSHRLWTSRFGGDTTALGRAIRLGGMLRTVVGVMPSGFDYPQGSEAWTPLAGELQGLEDVWGARWLGAVARLRPGAAPESAAAELTALLEPFPDARGYRAGVDPLQEQLASPVRRPLLLLLGAVVLVLLVACANVGSLLLSRALRRRRELAVRTALGAGRSRIAAALLLESVLVAAVGGALGAGAAWVGLDALLALAPSDLPRASQIGVNGRVLTFALAATLLTGVLAGLLPALRVRPDVAAALKEGEGAHGGDRSGGQARAVLVVLQVAVTVILLAGAGLLGRSFVLLLGQDRGFDGRDIVAVDLSLPAHRFEAEEGLLAAYDALLEQAASVPGVEAASISRNLPFADRRLGAPVHRPENPDARTRATHVSVTGGYFEMMGSRATRGRVLTREDDRDDRAVAVLSERLARELFGAVDPVGRTVVTMFGGVELEIVGVVEDVRFASLASDPEAVIYQPLSHWTSRGVHLVVRSQRPLASLAPALRDAIGAVHSEQPIREITTLETLVARSVARPRFYALLLGAFAACTLALAMIGFYGLLAGTVVQRRREIGIRMALGADAASVRRVVVRRAVLLTAAGAALGIGATVAGGRLIEGLLFGVAAADPPTLVGVGLLLVLASAAVAWAPARRATRVDPCEALRRE